MQTILDTLDIQTPKSSHSKQTKISKDEVFLTLLGAFEKIDEENLKNIDINLSENLVQDMDFLDSDEFFDSSNFMQILAILEALNGAKMDKFPVLNKEIGEFLSTKKNISEIKEAKNIFDLIKVAKKFNLNLEKIEFTKELGAKLEKKFPKLAEKNFFKPLKNLPNFFSEITKKEINKEISKSSPDKKPKILKNLLNNDLTNDDFTGKFEIKTKQNTKSKDNKEKNLKLNLSNFIKDEKNLARNLEPKSQIKEQKIWKDSENLAPKFENLTPKKTQENLNKESEIMAQKTQKSNLEKNLFKFELNAEIKEPKVQISKKDEKFISKLNSAQTHQSGDFKAQKDDFLLKEQINEPNLQKTMPNQKTQVQSAQITAMQSAPVLQNIQISQKIAPKVQKNAISDEFIPQKMEKPAEIPLKPIEISTQIPKKQIYKDENLAKFTPQTPKIDTLKSLLSENLQNQRTEQNLQSEIEAKNDENSKIQQNEIFAKNLTKPMQNTPKPAILKQTFDNFASNLKEQVQNYKPPIMRVSLRLNPANLGEIDITLINRGNNLHINFNSNPQTMNLFIQNHAEFKASLVNMGFNELQMNFSQQGNSGQQQQRKFKFNRSDDEISENSDLEQNLLEVVIPRYI